MKRLSWVTIACGLTLILGSGCEKRQPKDKSSQSSEKASKTSEDEPKQGPTDESTDKSGIGELPTEPPTITKGSDVVPRYSLLQSRVSKLRELAYENDGGMVAAMVASKDDFADCTLLGEGGEPTVTPFNRPEDHYESTRNMIAEKVSKYEVFGFVMDELVKYEESDGKGPRPPGGPKCGAKSNARYTVYYAVEEAETEVFKIQVYLSLVGDEWKIYDWAYRLIDCDTDADAHKPYCQVWKQRWGG